MFELSFNHDAFLSLPPQIYYYADSIYATAGVKDNDIQYVTVGTGAVNVFMTIAAVGTLFKSKLERLFNKLNL